MTMNRTIVGLLAILGLAACSKEEEPALDKLQELRLTSGIEAVTRADVQNTQIVANEKVWAWVSDVDKGTALYDAQQLTVGTNGELTGTTAMYFPQRGNAVRIRALHGTLSSPSPLVAGATAFPSTFDFTVAADQSAGGAAYVQSDLLYASREASKTKSAVPLKFYHLLSKLELNITKHASVTDNIDNITLDGVAVDGKFTPSATANITLQAERSAMVRAGNQTGTMTLGKALTGSNDAIVVPQAVGGKTLTFNLAGGGKLQYTFPAGKTFESGKKHVYNMTLTLTGIKVESSIAPWDTSEGTTTGETAFTPSLRIGDYFYSDGTYSTNLNTTKTVIGIVFQTNPRRIGQAEKDALAAKGVSEPHGLVMSIKNAATSVKWSNSYQDTALEDCPTIADNYKDISGLKNTTTIGTGDEFPAFKAIADFNGDNPVPSNATQWFLPSSGQLWDLIEILGKVTTLAAQRTSTDVKWDIKDDYCFSNLNSRLINVPTAEVFFAPAFLWSSSEVDKYGAWCFVVTTLSVTSHSLGKFETANVRPILAF